MLDYFNTISDENTLITNYLQQHYQNNKPIEVITTSDDDFRRNIIKKVVLSDINKISVQPLSSVSDCPTLITVYCLLKNETAEYRFHIPLLSVIAYINRKCNETFEYIKRNEIDIKENKSEFR